VSHFFVRYCCTTDSNLSVLFHRINQISSGLQDGDLVYRKVVLQVANGNGKIAVMVVQYHEKSLQYSARFIDAIGG